MSNFVDYYVINNCYATMWSYGEICVGCNCCGRIEKGLKMYESRLSYHKEQLEDRLNFNQWADGYPELISIQKKNVKASISYAKASISFHSEKIKQLEETIKNL